MISPPLVDCPIPGAAGFCHPEGTGRNRVLVLGEALGEQEAAESLPFRPGAEAGSVLERAFRKVGYKREDFAIYNVVPTRPPKNWLEGAPWEDAAILWGRPLVKQVIAEYKPHVILALGNSALRATMDLAGDSKYHGVTYLRGYPLPGLLGVPVIGSIHPSYLRRKSMAHFSVLMHDIKATVAFASGQRKFWSPVLWRDFDYVRPDEIPDPNHPHMPDGYCFAPTLWEAEHYLKVAEVCPSEIVAYDIETPYSSVTSEDETDELGDTDILSIQFSLGKGHGIFLPWREPFIDIAKAFLALPNDKATHNGWRFDNPLLLNNGCVIKGRIHDLRWAWKMLQPELWANLQCISSFYGACSRGPWKHMHASNAPYYGIRDVEELQYAFAP